MSISERLKDARLKAGLTQEYVADKINKKKSTISNWENGVSRPDVEQIVSLCKLYNTHPDDLFEEFDNYDKQESNEKYLDIIRKNPKLKTLLDSSRTITEENLEMLVNLAEQFNKIK